MSPAACSQFQVRPDTYLTFSKVNEKCTQTSCLSMSHPAGGGTGRQRDTKAGQGWLQGTLPHLFFFFLVVLGIESRAFARSYIPNLLKKLILRQGLAKSLNCLGWG